MRCYHCGNLVTNDLVFSDTCQLFFGAMEDDKGVTEKIYRTYSFLNYKCSTRGSINLFGGFDTEVEENNIGELNRLYPKGPNIVPPNHHWPDEIQPIPEKLVKTYEEIWYLKLLLSGKNTFYIKKGGCKNLQ